MQKVYCEYCNIYICASNFYKHIDVKKHIVASGNKDILKTHCCICDTKFKSKFGELKHMKKYHADSPSITCENCDETLPEYLYERHIGHCKTKEERKEHKRQTIIKAMRNYRIRLKQKDYVGEENDDTVEEVSEEISE